MARDFPQGVAHVAGADLEAALRSDPDVFELWRGLTPLGRNEFICWVDDPPAQNRANCGGTARGQEAPLLLARLHPSHRQGAQPVAAGGPDRGQGEGRGLVAYGLSPGGQRLGWAGSVSPLSTRCGHSQSRGGVSATRSLIITSNESPAPHQRALVRESLSGRHGGELVCFSLPRRTDFELRSTCCQCGHCLLRDEAATQDAGVAGLGSLGAGICVSGNRPDLEHGRKSERTF